MFKVGDKVRFKKEFYKEEYFKGLTREKRKRAADTASLGEFEVSYEDRRKVHVADKSNKKFAIDASLLELCKVEKKTDDSFDAVRYLINSYALAGIMKYPNTYTTSFPLPFVDIPNKKPEVKEVKRIAKVGEWIKIVDANYDPINTAEDYVNGDIFKVISSWVGVRFIGKKGKTNYAHHFEYVVLENYKPDDKPSSPPKEEPKKIAKVGDFIKIKEWSGGDKIGTIAEVVGIGCGNRVEYKSSNSPYGTYFSSFYEIVEPPKRKWTPEEIVQAKCFLAEELIHHHCSFSVFGNETRCYCFARCKTAVSKPDANDEYNEYIGAAVAYCKASGVKIPEFIKH